MKLHTSLLLLAGCIMYLQSLKSVDVIGAVMLIGSYTAISASVISICQNVYAKVDKD